MLIVVCSKCQVIAKAWQKVLQAYLTGPIIAGTELPPKSQIEPDMRTVFVWGTDKDREYFSGAWSLRRKIAISGAWKDCTGGVTDVIRFCFEYPSV